jgi:hypothetical protein
VSFLSIVFLTALPLAATPVLLHLFDRRRQVVIEWGAMHFLAEAASRRTSARKLKQWLLLLLRIMAIAALVLALARPMLPGRWLGGSDRTETIFILDNSMSMTRTVEGTPLFDQAVARTVDEIGELPPELQPKLLRVLEEWEVQPLGDARPTQVDVRVLVALQDSLEHAVASGRLRADLAARLGPLAVRLPTLADRREDIAPLFQRFIAQSHTENDAPRADPALIEALCLHEWPLNVRELELTARDALELRIDER